MRNKRIIIALMSEIVLRRGVAGRGCLHRVRTRWSFFRTEISKVLVVAMTSNGRLIRDG